MIEIKTQILDVGAIQRTVGWYEREAWSAARREGWQPRAVTSALILLGSEENDARVQSNGSVLKVSFPASGTELASWVDQATGRALPRAIATVDPRSRGAVWLRSTRSDGRRRSATYRDYADAAQRLLRR